MSVVEWAAASSVLVFSLFLMLVYFRLQRVLEPNVISIMYGFHILTQLIPAMVMLLDSSKPYAEDYFRACVLGALLIPFGGFVGNLLVPLSRSTPASLYGISLVEGKRTQRVARLFICLWALMCLVIFVAFIKSSKFHPLRELLFNASNINFNQTFRRDESAIARHYIFGLSMRFFMPFLFVSILANWQSFRSGLSRLLALVSVGMVFINNSYNTQKDPISLLFIMSILIFLLLRSASRTPIFPSQGIFNKKWKRLTMLTLAMGGTIGYPLFIFLMLPIGKTQTLRYLILNGIFGRIFWKPAMNSYYAFEMFSGYYDFTYFRDIGKLATVLGWQEYDLSSMVAFYKTGTYFNAPPASIGTFYAQAGWTGVIIGFLIAAIIFKACENLFIKQKIKTPMIFAMYSIILYAGFRFNFGYFHSILLTESIIPIICTLCLWHVFYVLCIGNQKSYVNAYSGRVPVRCESCPDTSLKSPER